MVRRCNVTWGKGDKDETMLTVNCPYTRLLVDCLAHITVSFKHASEVVFTAHIEVEGYKGHVPKSENVNWVNVTGRALKKSHIHKGRET
jgi:hypothetical protein